MVTKSSGRVFAGQINGQSYKWQWNVKESKNTQDIVLNNVRVYNDPPIIAKKTCTIHNDYFIRNNEEYVVINYNDQRIEAKSIITEDLIRIKDEELKFLS